MDRWKNFARDLGHLMRRAEISASALGGPARATGTSYDDDLDPISPAVRDWDKVLPILVAAQKALGETEVDLYSWRRRWDELNGDVRRFRDWSGGGNAQKSDRALKRDILPVRWSDASEQANPASDDGIGVDGFALLQALESLPTSTWRYDWEDPQTRHLGPMAQDWYAKFGLGNDNTTIATVDMAGVLITAIQALTQKIHRLEQEISHLKNK